MATMKRYLSGVILVGLLAGCTSTAPGSPTAAPASLAPVTSPVASLTSAFAHVATAALGDDGEFEFGDTVRLNALAAADKKVWGFEIYAGSGPLAQNAALLQDVLGVDLTKATSALTVGTPPARLVVITGGQDAATVTAAATKSGWTGSGTLTKAVDLSGGVGDAALISISTPQVRPDGADVTLGGTTADLSLSGAGKGAESGAVVAAGINCLGDVVIAQGTGFAGKTTNPPVAVGVRAGSGKITSVICLGVGSAGDANALADRVRTDLASGTSSASKRPYKDLLPGSTVEIVSDTTTMVRITADTTSQSPELVRQMLFQKDLPGGS